MNLLLALILAAVTAIAAWLLAFGDADRVGVAGTLLGGVVGFLAAWLIESSRRGHEDQHRFEAERRALYARFLESARAAEKVIRERQVLFSIRRSHPEFADRGEMPDRPDTTSLDQMRDEIELLAPANVYISSTIVGFMVDGLEFAVDGSEEEWKKASSELSDAMRQFLRRAKADLGTPTGVMTPWQNRRYRVKKRLRAWRQRG